jgi:hypothetical protein
MNFDRVDNYLEHFGKKGMKWGKRTAPSSSGEPKLKGRARSKAIIEARINTANKSREAMLLEDRAVVSKTRKEADYFQKKADKKYATIEKTSEYQLAQKSTRGEKIASGILLASVALPLAVVLGAK